jgi:hypothetical protein
VSNSSGQALTPEQRLEAFVAPCRLMAELYERPKIARVVGSM